MQLLVVFLVTQRLGMCTKPTINNKAGGTTHKVLKTKIYSLQLLQCSNHVAQFILHDLTSINKHEKVKA